jgi:seryl-tRNA synthetase
VGGSDPRVAFREELLGAGLLVATSVDGLYGRSAAFESVVAGLERLVDRAAEDHDATWLRFPPVIPRSLFEKTGYLRSFPNLTGSIHTFVGGDKEHREILAMLDAGEDWSSALAPAEVTLCSAACHPLFEHLNGPVPASGLRFDVLGWCFRHEPSLDPARLQAFRQREVVYAGVEAGAVAHRDLWAERASALLRDLGVEVEVVVANDPFFGRAGRFLAVDQRERVLKYEVVATVGDPENPTAIASANCHEDHFGRDFHLDADDGTVMHSACVGFGLERCTLALLRAHGLDPGAWPRPVRERLGL